MLEKDSLSTDGACAIEGVLVMMPKYKVHMPTIYVISSVGSSTTLLMLGSAVQPCDGVPKAVTAIKL